MHVLFLPSWYPETPGDIGGSFFREQALVMHHAGCKVGVIAPGMLSLRHPLRALRAGRSINKKMDAGIPTYRMAGINWTPRVWTLNAKRIERIGIALYRAYVADHGHPDVIHVHASLLAGAAAIGIAKRHNIPYILSEHSSAYARGLIPAVGIQIARSVAANADGRFAVSTPFARLLEDRLALPPGDFAVMPNIVDQSFLNFDLPRRDADKTRFLHVSLLDSNKRADLIVKAFARQFSQNHDVTLTIAGDGPNRGTLMLLAAELGVADRVNFLGRLSREEVRAVMAVSDAFILSSKHETFGVVLVEALAMGLPLVSTQCGGPEDIVTSDTGILVPTEDVDALATAMAQIYATRAQWPAEKLRADCALRFGPEVISKQWISHYERAIASRGMVA